MRPRPQQCARAMTALVVFALFAGGAVAFAQAVTSQPTTARPEDTANMRVTGVISVDFKDTPLKDAADYIGGLVGVNVKVAPGLEQQRITVRYDNLPYEDICREIAARLNLIVVRKGANLLQFENPPRVSITFTNAEIKQAIDLLARQADVNVVTAENIKGSVNLRLKNVPWEQALQTLVKTAGFYLVRDETGVMRVITKEMLREQQESRVFVLKYIQPPSAYIAKIQTEFAVGTPKPPVGDVEQDFTLFKTIKSVLGTDGEIQFDKDKNAIVVTAIPTKLAEVENVVKQVDIEPLQTFVDAKFVTTGLTDLLDFGTDWSQGRNVSPGVYVRGPFTPTAGPGMGSWGFVFGNPGPYGITPGVTPTGAFIDPTALNPPFIVGRRLWDAFGNPLAVGGGGGNFGILDFSQLAPIFSLLKRDDKSTVTQAPKLLVLDNQQATIFVGETVRFAETFSTSNQQGGVEFGIREAANSPVQTGFQRLLIPHVIRELNQVILTVIPQFESLTQGNSVAHPGFDEYTSGTMTILLPRVSHQTVVTKLKMDSGQTAVMGGLVNEQDIDQIDKVPILGDLPFGGWAFKKKVTNKTKRNLFIFLTLHVLDRAQESRAAVAEKIETDNEFRTGKPLYLKERVIKDAQEKSRREEDSRKAYAPILRGSEFKPYEK